jgi:hypothetical protein
MVARRFAPVVLLLLMGGIARAQVTVTKAEVVIDRKQFDPRNPPPEMPTLHPPEAAVTVSFFGADTRVGGTVTDSRAMEDGTTETSINVDTVRMTLRLRITVWLPSNSNAKIRNHEEGHRQIAEQFYKQADTIARQLADAMMGRTLVGYGRNTDQASSDALKKASNDLGNQYLAETDVPCFKAQQIYDRLTAHGTNALGEDAAVKRAIAEVKDPPASQPAISAE